MKEAMVRIEKLCKRYTSGRTEVQVLKNLDLEVKQGSCLLLQGPSGSGKTTLLNIIGTLTRPTSGRVFICGGEVSHLPEHFLVQLRRKMMGFVFQQYNLLHGYTALENIGMALLPLGVSARERIERGSAVLRDLSLDDRGDFRVNELSGGEQQRVSIARALVRDPELILADEPTSNVDQKNAEAILQIFTRLKSRGKTLIIASHDPLFVHSHLSDHSLEMAP
ncbi:ABC transporter ATP-binding protein [Acidobacteriota bacterium]